MSCIPKEWYAVQVDRDFLTGEYGEGPPRLYFNSNIYIYELIKSATYYNGKLTITTDKQKTYYLNTEPNNKTFKSSLFASWKMDDEKFLKNDDNRCDYEPWAFNSIEALAIELNVLNKDGVQMYYNKEFSS